MGIAEGLETKKEYIELGHKLVALETTGFNFGARFIPDAMARTQYNQKVSAYSQEIMSLVNQNKLSIKEAAKQANEMRNLIMDATRGKSCEIIKAWAFGKKASGQSLPHLEQKYSKRLYGKKFEHLSKGAKSIVWKEIVLKSGAPQAHANKIARGLGVAGRAFILATIVVSVYNVVTAEDKIKAASKESAVLGSGLLGSVAGGAAAGCVCGPGAPVCVGIGVFVGGVLFAIGADFTFDSFWR